MMKSPFLINCFLFIGSALSLHQDRSVLMERPLQATYYTVINVTLTISKMKIVNLKSMDVEYEIGLYQQWMDSRLAPDAIKRNLATAETGIWRPKITFATGQVTTVPDESLQFLGSRGAGNVLYSERYFLKTECSTNFQLFPFDKQRCLIKITSYRFPMDVVFLKWRAENPIEIKMYKELGSFHLIDFFTFTEIEKRPTGNFTILVAELLLSRQSDQLVLFSVTACMLCVLISYLALWIHIKAYGTRIFLSFTSMVAILGLHHCATTNLPQTTYLKPCDTWAILCSFYTFLPLIQTIAISAFNSHNYKEESDFNMEQVNRHVFTSSVDCMFRVMYPVLFLACVALYVVMFTI